MERHGYGGYYHPAAARPPPNYYYGRHLQHRPPVPAFLLVLMLPVFLLVLLFLAGAFSAPPPPPPLQFEPARESMRPPLFPILCLVLLLIAVQLWVPNRQHAAAVALVLALIMVPYVDAMHD